MRREFQREIPDGSDEEIRFALKWAESMLKQWFIGNSEGALFVGEPRRTLDQNSKLWPMLYDISAQVVWHGEKLQPEEWKDVMTAGLKRQRAVPGIDGGFVVLGAHTSRMGKREFSELIELIYAFGAEHGVEWSEPAKKAFADNRKAA